MHPLLPLSCDELCVREWNRWTSQITLKYSRLFPQVFLLLGGLTSIFQSGQPTDHFSDIILLLPILAWNVCICVWIYLISDEILPPKPRRGSVLLIGALVWEYLWWFQTLMPFVVQRCLSSSPVFLSGSILQVSENMGLSPLSTSFTLLMEMKWVQSLLASVALHGWRLSWLEEFEWKLLYLCVMVWTRGFVGFRSQYTGNVSRYKFSDFSQFTQILDLKSQLIALHLEMYISCFSAYRVYNIYTGL